MSDEEKPGSVDELRSAINANKRGWNDFWSWRDKPVGERGAAREVLNAQGYRVVDLRSREAGQDPPDCEATVDGQWCGIELTELVHRPTLERSIKAIKERKAGRQPQKPEAYFAWQQDDLLKALQQLIDAKDKSPKGGPYQRYMLVIFTDELFLDQGTVTKLLERAIFQADLITDVVLGLSYHPATSPQGGSYPVFRLALKPRW